MRRVTPRAARIATFLVLLLCVGCSFESNLSGVQCDEEGARDGERVCRDGYWTAADGVPDDATDSDDTRVDVSDADAADAPQCDANQQLCGGECVDVSTSSDHCGACDRPCEALGQNTVAECVGGACQRYCEPGAADANNDWRDNYDPAAGTDGCESTCEPTDPDTEVCDDVDNNCDGRVDEVEKTYYRDGDMDGFGSDEQVLETCSEPPDTYVEQGGDCNDTDPDTNPSINEEAQAGSCANADTCEICNGVDNDCDGSVDENCPCDFMGTATGICSTARLDEAGNCVQPDLYEADESSCDQVDNDCDGEEDEGCGCNYDGKAEGVCLASDVEPNGDCAEPAEYTGDEKDGWCDDGLDNDCDGQTDCEESGCDRKTCDQGKICVLGNCCNSPTESQMCSFRGLECGSVTATDRCGESRDLDCGGCGGGASCVSNACVEDKCDDSNDNDGDGDTDCEDADCDGLSCGGGGRICYQQSCCDPPDDNTFCKANNIQCGNYSGTDACGETRTDVDCGNCGGGSSCASNTCIEDNCNDNKDNDGDGQTDCDDSDCSC